MPKSLQFFDAIGAVILQKHGDGWSLVTYISRGLHHALRREVSFPSNQSKLFSAQLGKDISRQNDTHKNGKYNISVTKAVCHTNFLSKKLLPIQGKPSSLLRVNGGSVG